MAALEADAKVAVDAEASGSQSPRGSPRAGRVLPLLILFGLNAVDELDRRRSRSSRRTSATTSTSTSAASSDSSARVTFLALGGQVLVGYYADRRPRVRMAISAARVWGLFTLRHGPGADARVPRRRPRRLRARQGRHRPDPQLADRRLLPARGPTQGLRLPSSRRTRSARSSARSSPVVWRTTSAGALPFIVFAIPTAVLRRSRGQRTSRAGARQPRALGDGRTPRIASTPKRNRPRSRRHGESRIRFARCAESRCRCRSSASASAGSRRCCRSTTATSSTSTRSNAAFVSTFVRAVPDRRARVGVPLTVRLARARSGTGAAVPSRSRASRCQRRARGVRRVPSAVAVDRDAHRHRCAARHPAPGHLRDALARHPAAGAGGRLLARRAVRRCRPG